MLHRAAPMMANWDDHELTNNAYGMRAEDNTGAENHQPTCPVDRSFPDEDKAAAQCDTDEGLASVRFNDAINAYMEWMPIREYPGTIGIGFQSNNQVVEWG